MSVKIFIADEHSLVSQSIGTLLDRVSSFEIVGLASNGRTVVSLVGELKPDLILISNHLKDLNGLETVRKIREKYDVKILMMISGNDRSGIFRALGLGVDGCISKQADAEELLIAVREVSSGGSYLSSCISRIVFDEMAVNRGNHPEFENTILSPRAMEVLQLLAEGYSSRDISEMLKISSKTVDWHRTQVMKKLRIENFAGLVKYAINEGLVSACAY